MARKRIQWPFKGRVDNNAQGDQPELTTSDAKNVRNYAAGTERMQGGQRPGLAKLNAAQPNGSNAVRSVSSLVYDRPAFNYIAGRSEDWAGANETDSSTLDVLVDEGGNSYWLTQDAVIEKRNADGVLLWSEAVPLGTFTALERFAIDADGNIYLALIGPQGQQGRIIKLEVAEDDDAASIAWVFETDDGEFADILYRAGTLFVAVNKSSDEEAFVYAITGLDGTQPTVSTTYDLTYPVRQIAISKGGLVYATAPSDARSDRDLTDGVGSGEVDWTPLDLNNWEERLHCWIDARSEAAAAPGTQVGMFDQREAYRVASGLATEYTDQTSRGHAIPVHSNGQLPKYDPNGLVIFPAYKFDPTVGSVNSGIQPYLEKGSGALPALAGIGEWHRDKVNTSDSLSRSGGLYPQVLTHTWATTMLVRTRTTEPMALWLLNMANSGSWSNVPFPNYIALTIHAHGWGNSSAGHPDEAEYPYFSEYGVLGNAANQNYTAQWNANIQQSTGVVALYTPYWRVPFAPIGTATDTDIDDVDDLPVLQESSGTDTRAIEVHAPTISGAELENVFLISLICEYDSGSSEYRIRIRVNSNEDLTGSGANYGLFKPENFKRTPARDCLGGKVWGGYPGGATGDFANSGALGGISSFDGWVCEAITYFGDSSLPSSPHDASYGTRGSGGFFDEVEKVEAYMAWKWGVQSSVLNTSGGAGTVSGNQYTSNAPTGGSGTTVSDVVTGQRIVDALSSTQGITAKVSLINNQHLWAYAGAGMGYAVGVDETEGLIYTYGPKDLGYPTSGGNPITGSTDYDFGVIGRKIVDVGPFARIRRYGFAEIHFYENPQASDTLAFSDGTTTNTITFVAIGATGTQVNIGADLDATFDDASAGGFQEKIMAAVQGTGSFSALTEPGYAIFAPKGVTDVRVLRIYALDFYSTPLMDITSSEPSRFKVIFQQFPGSDGIKSADPDNSAWCFGGDYQAGAADPDDIPIRIAVDADGNAYVPSRGNLSGGTKDNHIYRLSRKAQSDVTTDVINTRVTGISGYGTNWRYDLNAGVVGATDYAARAIAVKPELEHVYPVTSIDGPEYLWIANDNVKADGTVYSELNTRHRIALISRTTTNQDVRNVLTFAVAGSNAYKRNGASWTSIGSVARTSGSAFTKAVAAYGQMFFVDNGLYKVYDPIKDGGVLEPWEADTAGEIPEGCRLAAFYRGRMVLARSDREPNTIFASAVGDPYDWDFFPKVDRLTKAFGGANQDTARNPDVVNALAPFYDDVLLVGGDHSITQYRGDLSEIGQIDYFTDVTGMAFGDSWALSPEGLMYFFGSRGGVWVMSPTVDGRSQPPIELTRDTIAETLRDVDLSQYMPKLVWDQECQGLHVFITPLTGSVSATTQHWFWEARTKSWWPQLFGATTLQPYSAALLEGLTPSDRKVAIGCDDGYVRVFDKTASNDDGTAIESNVLIGPIFAPDTPAEQRISSLHAIVANIGAGCRYTLYASDNPESLGTAVASGDLVAGYNDRVPARARGGYIWIKLENATGGGQWALESLHAELHLAGRRRDR